MGLWGVACECPMQWLVCRTYNGVELSHMCTSVCTVQGAVGHAGVNSAVCLGVQEWLRDCCVWQTLPGGVFAHVMGAEPHCLAAENCCPARRAPEVQMVADGGGGCADRTWTVRHEMWGSSGPSAPRRAQWHRPPCRRADVASQSSGVSCVGVHKPLDLQLRAGAGVTPPRGRASGLRPG